MLHEKFDQNKLNNLTELHLGSYFNQNISYFKYTLTNLTNLCFGYNFNQDISSFQ